jgi:multicomponent Na+:H+ antiporter subunit A
MNVLAAVLSGFVAALLAPALVRLSRRAAGWLLALLPAALTVYFIGLSGGAPWTEVHAWVPSLGVSLSFYLDGLSLLFAILISGIGALVVLYAGEYLRDDAQLGRFFAYILAFMASMLGLVLAGNVLGLFVFWELTSLTSYLLIGYDHERAPVRNAALQALLVTGLGGLAMLAGFLIQGGIAGGYEMETVLAAGNRFREHALYLPALALILAGAFAKSAQFPFHFWLPNAMEAPTPVSAYLHSATMVKAGVYLMMRLYPVLGGTDAWLWSLGLAGGITMLLGAFLALRTVDYKRVLAYSTVSVLGLLTMLLGLGSEAALSAAVVYLFAHALYKGALFLVAGAVAHEAGARDLDQVSGLRRAMPLTAAAAALAGLSMMGLPPFFGFLAKELFYGAARDAATTWVLSASFAASVMLVAVAVMTAWQPFFGGPVRAPRKAHEAPLGLWLGPAVMAALGLLFGVFPALITGRLLSPALSAMSGGARAVHLSLWHGLDLTLGLSALTLAAGGALYAGRSAFARLARPLEAWERIGAERWYHATLQLLQRAADSVTTVFQSGYLRYYILTIVTTALGLGGYTLARYAEVPLRLEGERPRFHELGIALLMVLATWEVLQTRSRLGAIAALGAVGYGVALTFVFFGAPDLAMTQFLIETLFVILFVLVFYHLPQFARLSSARARVRDAVLAILFGGMMTALVLAATSIHADPKLADYFNRNSAALAHGRNIVNVILVDFRGLDTLGEITVLGIAAVGVYALLKLRLARKEAP